MRCISAGPYRRESHSPVYLLWLVRTAVYPAAFATQPHRHPEICSADDTCHPWLHSDTSAWPAMSAPQPFSAGEDTHRKPHNFFWLPASVSYYYLWLALGCLQIQPNHVLHLIKYDVYLYILVSHDQLTISFSSVWSSSACSASKVTFYKQRVCFYSSSPDTTCCEDSYFLISSSHLRRM